MWPNRLLPGREIGAHTRSAIPVRSDCGGCQRCCWHIIAVQSGDTLRWGDSCLQHQLKSTLKRGFIRKVFCGLELPFLLFAAVKSSATECHRPLFWREAGVSAALWHHPPPEVVQPAWQTWVFRRVYRLLLAGSQWLVTRWLILLPEEEQLIICLALVAGNFMSLCIYIQMAPYCISCRKGSLKSTFEQALKGKLVYLSIYRSRRSYLVMSIIHIVQTLFTL